MKIDLNQVREFTRQAEGQVRLNNGNHKLYKCPAKKQTVGYGYNLQDNGLPEDMAQELLRRELDASQSILALNVKGWDKLSHVRKSVLIDMCYNMGWPALSKFKNMFAAIDAEDFEEAARQMMDSKWYRQVKVRGVKLVQAMRTNEWQEY
jgi:lysozyme